MARGFASSARWLAACVGRRRRGNLHDDAGDSEGWKKEEKRVFASYCSSVSLFFVFKITPKTYDNLKNSKIKVV